MGPCLEQGLWGQKDQVPATALFPADEGNLGGGSGLASRGLISSSGVGVTTMLHSCPEGAGKEGCPQPRGGMGWGGVGVAVVP